MLGEVEETIYVVEEEDDEDETVKVSHATPRQFETHANPMGIDHQEAVGDAFCPR